MSRYGLPEGNLALTQHRPERQATEASANVREKNTSSATT